MSDHQPGPPRRAGTESSIEEKMKKRQPNRPVPLPGHLRYPTLPVPPPGGSGHASSASINFSPPSSPGLSPTPSSPMSPSTSPLPSPVGSSPSSSFGRAPPLPQKDKRDKRMTLPTRPASGSTPDELQSQLYEDPSRGHSHSHSHSHSHHSSKRLHASHHQQQHSTLPRTETMSQIVKAGYMWKLGHGLLPAFNRRWFVLGNGKLSYYAHQTSLRCKGAVELEGYLVQLYEDDKLMRKLRKKGVDHGVLFMLRPQVPSKREYIFGAESEIDQNQWISSLTLEMFRDRVVHHRKPPDSTTRRMSVYSTMSIMVHNPDLPVEAASGAAEPEVVESESEREDKDPSRRDKGKGGPMPCSRFLPMEQQRMICATCGLPKASHVINPDEQDMPAEEEDDVRFPDEDTTSPRSTARIPRQTVVKHPGSGEQFRIVQTEESKIGGTDYEYESSSPDDHHDMPKTKPPPPKGPPPSRISGASSMNSYMSQSLSGSSSPTPAPAAAASPTPAGATSPAPPLPRHPFSSAYVGRPTNAAADAVVSPSSPNPASNPVVASNLASPPPSLRSSSPSTPVSPASADPKVMSPVTSPSPGPFLSAVCEQYRPHVFIKDKCGNCRQPRSSHKNADDSGSSGPSQQGGLKFCPKCGDYSLRGTKCEKCGHVVSETAASPSAAAIPPTAASPNSVDVKAAISRRASAPFPAPGAPVVPSPRSKHMGSANAATHNALSPTSPVKKDNPPEKPVPTPSSDKTPSTPSSEGENPGGKEESPEADSEPGGSPMENIKIITPTGSGEGSTAPGARPASASKSRPASVGSKDETQKDKKKKDKQAKLQALLEAEAKLKQEEADLLKREQDAQHAKARATETAAAETTKEKLLREEQKRQEAERKAKEDTDVQDRIRRQSESVLKMERDKKAKEDQERKVREDKERAEKEQHDRWLQDQHERQRREREEIEQRQRALTLQKKVEQEQAEAAKELAEKQKFERQKAEQAAREQAARDAARPDSQSKRGQFCTGCGSKTVAGKTSCASCGAQYVNSPVAVNIGYVAPTSGAGTNNVGSIRTDKDLVEASRNVDAVLTRSANKTEGKAAVEGEPKPGALEIYGLPPAVKELNVSLNQVHERFENLTAQQVSAGQGSVLYNDLKALLVPIKNLRTKFPAELKGAVAVYNTLNKTIPQKVNTLLRELQQGEKAVPEGQCAGCKQPLTGQTVEAIGSLFHVDCFKCFTCGRKFVKTCLNIDGKPYCDLCGRKAFISSKSDKTKSS